MVYRIYFQFKFVKNVFDLYCVDELCEILSMLCFCALCSNFFH